jgi:hypothetical protein
MGPHPTTPLSPLRIRFLQVRNAKAEGCYVNASVAHLLPPPPEPLYTATSHVCPWRGAVRCHFHSFKCALLRDSPLPDEGRYGSRGLRMSVQQTRAATQDSEASSQGTRLL